MAQRRDGYIEKGERARGTAIEIERRSFPPSLSHPIAIHHPKEEEGCGINKNGIFEEGGMELTSPRSMEAASQLLVGESE